MKNQKKMLPHLAVSAGAFYLLPLAIRDTGSGMLVLLFCLPAVCFGAALACGAKNGFVWYYPCAVAALFVPTIPIFYNSSAWVYVVGYGAVALLGVLLGALLHRRA